MTKRQALFSLAVCTAFAASFAWTSSTDPALRIARFAQAAAIFSACAAVETVIRYIIGRRKLCKNAK